MGVNTGGKTGGKTRGNGGQREPTRKTNIGKVTLKATGDNTASFGFSWKTTGKSGITISPAVPPSDN